MFATNDARDRGPLPLELPIGMPEAPGLPSSNRRPRSEGDDAGHGRTTLIEIDLVVTDDDDFVRPHRVPEDDTDEDERDRSRGNVIEISLV
jgi:hypothetical protein